MATRTDDLVGNLAVERGYVTQGRLDEAREAHRSVEAMGIDQPLIHILVGKHLLTEDQAQELRHAVAIQTGEARLVAGYEVIAKLGQGGMGAVYRARKLDTGELVALKILLPSLATPEYIKRFEREARIVRTLDHVNIVKCVEFGYDRKRKVHFCALELVEGEDLARRVERVGLLGEGEAVSITYQVAQALQHACFNGLVHRDVKPENVMVTPDGTAKLLDLGLARSANQEATRVTQSGAFVGTAYYCSPEQARGEREIDIRSDIYSLGATLYYLVTGHPPFEGGTSLMVLQQQVYEQITWPAEMNPLLSDGICRVIARMMAKEPDDRYEVPKKLLVDLDMLREGREVEIGDDAIRKSSVKLRVVPRRARAARARRERRAADRHPPRQREGAGRRESGRAEVMPRAGRGMSPAAIAGIVAGAVALLVIVLAVALSGNGRPEGPGRRPPDGVSGRGHVAGVDSRPPDPGVTGEDEGPTPPGRNARAGRSAASPEARVLAARRRLAEIRSWDDPLLRRYAEMRGALAGFPKEFPDAAREADEARRLLVEISARFDQLARFALGKARRSAAGLARAGRYDEAAKVLGGVRTQYRYSDWLGAGGEAEIQAELRKIENARLARAGGAAGRTGSGRQAGGADGVRTVPPGLTRGLVGHWTFDGRDRSAAPDLSGKGHHARLVGGATPVADGKVGGAVYLAGGDDRVEIGDIKAKAHTFALWVDFPEEVTGRSKSATLVRYGSNGLHHVIVLGDVSRSVKNETLGVKTAGGRNAERTFIADSIPQGWRHIAFRWAGGRYEIHVDGDLRESMRIGGSSASLMEVSNLVLGGGAYANFVGKLDEVMVYDRTLSPEEIRLLAHPEGWAKAAPRAGSATRALDALLTEFDSLMAKGDHAAARQYVQAEAAKPANARHRRHADALRAAARVAKALEERADAIRRAAEALKGKPVQLLTGAGVRKGEVRKVEDAGIVLATRYRIGAEEFEKAVTVSWADLANRQDDELARQGGWRQEGPAGAVARAYLELSRKDMEAAEREVAAAGAHPLSAHIRERIEAPRREAAQAAAHAAEEAARAAWGEIERRAGASGISAAQARSLLKRMAAFEKEHAGTELAASAAGKLVETKRRVELAALVPTASTDLGEGVALEMICVMPGSFMMGSTRGGMSERPVHKVMITRAFYLGKCEVTNEQYDRVMGTKRAAGKESNLPVVGVSWHEAAAFCREVSDEKGMRFRLPTEAEWEYACRAGAKTEYCFGDDPPALGEYAWYDGNSGDRAHPVGGKRANTWGFFDMHGNVKELCADWFDLGYYARSAREDPKGPDTGTERGRRGGCYHYGAADCRSARRGRTDPVSAWANVGFRVALDPGSR